ncbi:AraC family transcriptional regulator [Paenibacillus sp. 79R4]|uniref:AraC family transcriptional regulator n=1 Tax=Paenibacillus sp. 79R4 TaxID=2212847 RepID=UPI0015B93A0A|nr:AraC family transcriptional regulator [Paenibacillus sp. 79R4]NWL90324.1 AraC family transcriptional regulator [Paenibacillus sp. 79R4]
MDKIKKQDGFMSQLLIVLPDHILEAYAAHPLIRPLYITDIGYFPHAQHHYRERPTGSESYIILYCIEGEGWIRLAGQKQQTMQKGALIVIPAHTPHEYASSEDHPWTIYWFHMKGEQVGDYFEGIDEHTSPTPVSVEHSSQIIKLFQDSYNLLQKGYSLDRIIYVSQLAGHLAAFIRFNLQHPHLALNRQKKHDVEESLQYMTEHLDKNVTLQELADQAKLSVPHYTHVFKKTTGYSPIDYYLRLKIQRACQYLDLTEQSMKEISIQLGFQDPYYFSRLFKKIMGKSPSAYRNTRKG